MIKMADNSRRGAADLGMPLMVVAFLVIGGFMYWLQAEAATQKALQLVEVTEPEVATDASGATIIDPADIQLDASSFEGQLIRIEHLNVASLLGTQGFWLELPNGNPFLVSMNDAVMAQALAITMGGTATASGMLTAMTPEIAQAWVDAGTIGEGDQLAAEFATHYLDAGFVGVGTGN